jgi:acyl-CoA thioesterase YciA
MQEGHAVHGNRRHAAAGGWAASRIARGRVATVAVDGMSFLHPVRVGDEVTVWTEFLQMGRTSMRFRISAWRRPRDSDRHSKVTEATFTFVAIDSDGKPRPVAPPLPEVAAT